MIKAKESVLCETFATLSLITSDSVLFALEKVGWRSQVALNQLNIIIDNRHRLACLHLKPNSKATERSLLI